MKKMLMRIQLYLPLIKSLQTGLLLATGVAGYMSARCPILSWGMLAGLIGSLFFAISGSTILNMWHDRDIDSVMNRTHHRPIASGRVAPNDALRLGSAKWVREGILAQYTAPAKSNGKNGKAAVKAKVTATRTKVQKAAAKRSTVKMVKVVASKTAKKSSTKKTAAKKK